MTKTIVCLANSTKTGGRCVAGKDIVTGEWVRPVSARRSEEINLSESRLSDGTQPLLLDILEIPMLHASPHGHQIENHTIDPRSPWRKVGKLLWGRIHAMQDHQVALWNLGAPNQFPKQDRVSTAHIAQASDSLRLIHVNMLTIKTEQYGDEGRAKKKCRGLFDYLGVRYNLEVTDPVAHKVFRPGVDRPVDVHDLYLCISLTGAAFGGSHYKLIAGVLHNNTITV